MRDTAEVFDHHAIDADVIAEQARSDPRGRDDRRLEGRLPRLDRGRQRGRRDPVRLPRRAAGGLPAEPLLGRGRRAAGLPRRVPRAGAAADRGAGRQPPDAAPTSCCPTGTASGRRRRASSPWPPAKHGARYVLVTEHARCPTSSSTTCWPRRRARSRARSSSASRPPSSAPATRSRPRWRRCSRPAPSCTPPSARRWPSSTRRLDAGFRPGMGNVMPDRFFWALPRRRRRRRRAGDDARRPPMPKRGAAPKNPRHVH